MRRGPELLLLGVAGGGGAGQDDDDSQAQELKMFNPQLTAASSLCCMLLPLDVLLVLLMILMPLMSVMILLQSHLSGRYARFVGY